MPEIKFELDGEHGTIFCGCSEYAFMLFQSKEYPKQIHVVCQACGASGILILERPIDFA